MRIMKHLVHLAALSLSIALVSTASAESLDLSMFGGDSILHPALNPTRTACERAGVRKAQIDQVAVCRALDTKQRAALLALADATVAKCQSGFAAETANQESQKALREAVDEVTTKAAAVKARQDELRKATDSERAARETALESAQGELTSAQAKVANAAQLNEATRLQTAVVWEAVKRDNEASQTALDAELERIEMGRASPADFQKFLADEKRRAACSAVTKADLAKTLESARLVAAKAEAAAEDDHVKDLMRKSSNMATALTDANALIENPGAPDAVTFSVMTALGAAKETSGTQTILTLNLATAFVPKERLLVLPAAVRNLFVRAQLPLSKTTDETIGAGTSNPTDVETSARRFQFILGTSVVDDSDTRLETNESCYLAAFDYLPYSRTEEQEANRESLRKTLFDVCANVAAHEQRLALRAGIGLITRGSGEEAKTNTELAAAALVWGPTPWLYFNALYQRLLEPTKVHTFGAGVSLGLNVGGASSGTHAWARLALNALWIFSIPDADNKLKLEGRLAPAVQFKLADAITSFSVGPTFVGGGNTGVLASLAVTYDADRLIAPLLTPLANP